MTKLKGVFMLKLQEEVKKELEEYGIIDEYIIELGKDEFDRLCNSYSFIETQNFYVITGIDLTSYYIEIDEYDNN